LRGRLSLRMSSPDNIWQQLWSSAAAVPVSKQTPLFDHQKEAERVLDDLQNIPPAALLSQLCAVALMNTTFILSHCEGANVPSVKEDLTQLHRSMRSLDFKSDFAELEPVYTALATELTRMETVCARATSLTYYFPACRRLQDELVVSAW